MREPASIAAAGGRLFLGPPGLVPMRPSLLRGTGPQSDLSLLFRDPRGPAELRRQWHRLGLPGDARHMSDADMRAGMERAVRSGRLASLYVPQSRAVTDDGGRDNGPGPGERKGPVRTWSQQDKIAEALSRSRFHLTGELRALVEDMVQPANIAIMVGFIAALVAAHFATGPVAVALDVAIIGLAYAYAGYAGVKAMIAFFQTSLDVTRATSEAQIDKAAREYAAHFVALGTAVLSRFIGRAKARRSKPQKPAPKPAPKTSSAQPSATPKTQAQRQAAPAPPPVRRVYRGDGRPPETIFKDGFQPRGTSTDLKSYVDKNTSSSFVGTSTDPKVARDFAAANKGYVYEIDPSKLKGIDVNQAYKANPFAAEKEIAFQGGIPRSAIVSARPVRPDGSVGNVIPNPFYKGGK